MTSEQDRWNRLRDQAESHLPNDFARRVVRSVQNRNRAARREYVLIAATAGFCLLSVAIANWYVGNRIQERNLTLWSIAEAQIKALRTSI
jgi:hypothetical protein